MEKFLFILRESGVNSGDQRHDEGFAFNPGLEEWIHSLTQSGNYYYGVPVADSGQYVTGEKMKGHSFGDANDCILRFDVIMAENIDQAVSIARTNPLVTRGTAKIELRAIFELVR